MLSLFLVLLIWRLRYLWLLLMLFSNYSIHILSTIYILLLFIIYYLSIISLCLLLSILFVLSNVMYFVKIWIYIFVAFLLLSTNYHIHTIIEPKSSYTLNLLIITFVKNIKIINNAYIIQINKLTNLLYTFYFLSNERIP